MHHQNIVVSKHNNGLLVSRLTVNRYDERIGRVVSRSNLHNDEVAEWVSGGSALVRCGVLPRRWDLPAVDRRSSNRNRSVYGRESNNGARVTKVFLFFFFPFFFIKYTTREPAWCRRASRDSKQRRRRSMTRRRGRGRSNEGDREPRGSRIRARGPPETPVGGGTPDPGAKRWREATHIFSEKPPRRRIRSFASPKQDTKISAVRIFESKVINIIILFGFSI